MACRQHNLKFLKEVEEVEEEKEEEDWEDYDSKTRLYCRSCKFHARMDDVSHLHDFICRTCNKLIIGLHGHEIIKYSDISDRELYVSVDMFLFL